MRVVKRHSVLTNFFIFSVGILLLWQAVKPLFHPGLFSTIDNIVVVRVESMANELSNGQFPVRYASELGRGRGYMLFNFYAPLPFYVGAMIHKAGTNLVGAVKRTYLIAFIIAAVGMYFFAKEFFGKIGGLVAATFFVFSPYIGYDVYWRGGLGEVWAISLLPVVFWLFYKVSSSQRAIFTLGAAFATAALILSHNLTTYMAFPFLLCWIFYCWKTTKTKIMTIIAPLLLGIGISTFFWLPALIEKSFVWVTYSQANKEEFFRAFTTDLKGILFPTFIPMMIHWVYIFIPFVSLFLLKRYSRFVKLKSLILLLSIFAIVGALLTTVVTKPIWEILYAYMYIFQFPWRFWIIATFFSSLLAGWIVFALGKGRRYRHLVIASFMIAGIIYYDLPDFQPTHYEFIDRYRAEDPCGTTWGIEYFPIWVNPCVKEAPGAYAAISKGSGKILSIHRESRFYSIHSEGDTRHIRAEEYYYPGWIAKIDGQEAPVRYDNPNGLIEVVVPEGEHTVELRLTETPLRKTSNALSVIALILTPAFSFMRFRKRLR